jgi:dihydropyrimidinase
MGTTKTTLIRGGGVVVDQSVFQMDVIIEDERIAALGNRQDFGKRNIDRTVDASGLLVLPGAIDSHVHFNDVFMNTISVHDYHTGTLAAAFGGVTSIIDFANQGKNESLLKTIANKHDEARGRAMIDWGVHPVVTHPTPETLREMPQVIAQGAPTLKCYMTYRSEGLLIEDDDLRNILRILRESGGMLLLHAEDNDMIENNVSTMIAAGWTKPIHHAKSRPSEAENRALRRCVEMARETGGTIFIVHLASADGLPIIENARQEGVSIYAETCTHYLVFTDDMLRRDDGIKWICSPPLRDHANQERLWQGLQSSIISLVTSDDAAYSWQAKLMGQGRFDRCPNGIPGIETRVHLLYSEGVAKGRISLPRFVELISTAPADFFGLSHQKGRIIPGADADIMLLDPHEEWLMNQDSLHMATDWSAYENITVRGRIQKVFSRGELIVDQNRCLAEKGRGRYLHRQLGRNLDETR